MYITSSIIYRRNFLDLRWYPLRVVGDEFDTTLCEYTVHTYARIYTK